MADVVVHLRILSQTRSGEAKVKVVKVYKGKFDFDLLGTSGASMCGLGDFVAGEEYVFFLASNKNYVDIFSMGHASTESLLKRLGEVR